MSTPVYPPTITTNILVNTRTQPKIVYLPAVSTIGPGRMFFIKDICGNAGVSSIYLSTTGLDSFDYRFRPSTLYALMSTNFQSVLLASDGQLNWLILQNYNSNVIMRQASFDPTSISGLQLWLDATNVNGDGSSISNGASVTSWTDRSGSGFTMTNTSGANRPTYNTSGLGTGYPSLSFTAAGASYLRNTASSLFNNTSWDIYCVIKVANTTTHAGILVEYPSTNWLWAAGASGSTNFSVYANGGWALAPNTGPSLTTSQVYQLYSTGSQLGRRINGSFPGSVTDQYVSYSYGSRSGTRLIGIFSQGSIWSNNNLDIGELIVYNTSLTTIQRQQIEGYLAWRWGLQANLPADNPYKNAPP
jgi:hypothetical protein